MAVQRTKGCRIRDGKIQIWFSEKGSKKRTYRTLEPSLFPCTAAGIKEAQTLREKIRFEIKHNLYEAKNYWEEDRINAGGYFKEWAQRWLNLPENGWSGNTRRKYKGLLQKYWMPYFHAWDIATIEYSDLVDALIEADTASLSASYYNDILVVIRGVIGLYAKSSDAPNPAEKLNNKVRVKDEPDPFTIDEACQIIECAKQYGWGEWFQIGFFTGLRSPGEMLGLKAEDYHDNSIKVKRQRIYDGTIQNHTKTKRARTINLNSIAAEAVERLINDNDYLFNHIDGSPVTSNRSQSKAWKKILDELGLRYRTMYNMRHTYATYCLMQNMNPAYVASQLGHSIEEFFKTYAKWVNGLMNEAQTSIIEASIKESATIMRLKNS